MVKKNKSQRLREKMKTDVKNAKQTTLSSPPEIHAKETAKAAAPEVKKEIEISEISISTRGDELVLRVAFKLAPSRTLFSRVTSDLYFDWLKVDSLRLRVVQGPLATEESEFATVLDMTGISEGKHSLRVEMYELWDSTEKLTNASKEATIEYVPVKIEERLRRIPIIKSSAGPDLDIISDTEKNIYREIEKELKKDSESRRDHW